MTTETEPTLNPRQQLTATLLNSRQNQEIEPVIQAFNQRNVPNKDQIIKTFYS